MRSTAISALKRLRLDGLVRPLYFGARRAAATVRSAPAAASRGIHWVADAPKRAQLAAGYRAILASRIEFEQLLGASDDSAVALVMCLWNRPGRIVDILRLVDSQASSRRIRLVLWNNQPANAQHYRDAIAAYTATGALDSVELFDSPTNIGGIGRFVAMRELVLRGYSGSYLMLDDDENITPSFVDDLLATAGPHTIGSIWAWRHDGRYWNRVPLEHTGEIANHTGTGGCVCDSVLVSHPDFFTGIPLKYLFMEDIWMSHCGTRNGWTLIKVDSPVEFVLAELDQGHAIYDRKEKFFSWLQRPGNVPDWN